MHTYTHICMHNKNKDRDIHTFMHTYIHTYIQNRFGFWGSAPDPLVVRGFLSSAITASSLPRLQFLHSHVLECIPYSFQISVFSSGSPYLIPVSAPVGPMNYGYLCGLCPPPNLCLWALCPHHEKISNFPISVPQSYMKTYASGISPHLYVRCSLL